MSISHAYVSREATQKEVGDDIILSEYENGGLIITGHGLYKVVRHVIGNLVRSDNLTERASAQYGMEDSR